MAGTFLWNFIKIWWVISEKKMFKEKVNAQTDTRTDARQTTGHDISSLLPVELKMKFVLERVETLWEKEEMLVTGIICSFPTMFSEGYSGSFKVGIVW